MEFEFNAFATTGLIFLLVLLFIAARRKVTTGQILDDEVYHASPDGRLSGPGFQLDPAAKLLKTETESIPLEQISGVFVQGKTSRRLLLGILLRDDRAIPLSMVHNNDGLRAAVNAAALAEAIAGQGDAFRLASNQNNWGRTIMGETFEYRFS